MYVIDTFGNIKMCRYCFLIKMHIETAQHPPNCSVETNTYFLSLTWQRTSVLGQILETHGISLGTLDGEVFGYIGGFALTETVVDVYSCDSDFLSNIICNEKYA